MPTVTPLRRVCFFLTIYNEEYALPGLLQSLSNVSLPSGTAYSIYAVDDASTDTTPAILERAKTAYPITVLRYEINRGVPATIKDAFAYFARELTDDDVVIFMEADGTSDVSLIPRMLEKIDEGNDMVIASRYTKGAISLGFPWYRLLGSALVNYFLRLVWNVKGVTDYSIFYRAYRASLIKKCFGHGYVPLRAKKSFAVIAESLLFFDVYHPRIAEVPLRYDYRIKKKPSRMKLLPTLFEYMRITIRTPLHRQPIFWIAVGAFVLRVWGMMYGFPDLLVQDEPALTRGALLMLKLHTLIPALHPVDFAPIYYPPFTSYLYLLVLIPVVGTQYLFSHLSLSAFAAHLVLDPTVPWAATRVVSALFGALTVYVLGRLGERLYHQSGIYAALFAATSFLFLTFSHVARHWSLSVLLFCGMLFAAYYIYYKGTLRWYILAGVFAGLAFGTGVVSSAFFIVPIFAHLARGESWRAKLLNRSFLAMGLIALVLASVFMLLDPHTTVTHLIGNADQDNTYRETKTLLGAITILVVAVRDLGQTETVLFLCALIGVPLLLRRHRVFGSILCLCMILLTLLFYMGYYYLLHYLLFVLPILILFAGVGAHELINFAKTRTAQICIAILIFLLPTLIALRFSYLWTQTDTRQQARQYIEAHIPADARIVSYVPDMKVVWPTASSVQERLVFDPASSRLVDTTLLALPQGEYPQPTFSVFELGTISDDMRSKVVPQWLLGEHFEYAVIDRSAEPLPALDALAAQGEIVARFPRQGESINIIGTDFEDTSLDVFKINQMGPEVDIIKLPQ
ncbi:MAG: glycosyltransferase [Minisyncoccia bacterium]